MNNCELSGFGCYRLVPKVTYSWIPGPSSLKTFSAFYKLDYGPDIALATVKDSDRVPIPEQARITTHESSFLAVRNGQAGDYDNIHTAHPGQGIFVPGCRYMALFDCAHMHWRWPKVPAGEDSMVEPSTGETLSGIKGTPNLVPGQTIAIAMVKFKPGEEDPDDPSTLLNGEQLATVRQIPTESCRACYVTTAENPVVWYVTSVQDKPSDTLFRHGTFVLDTVRLPRSSNSPSSPGPQMHSGH